MPQLIPYRRVSGESLRAVLRCEYLLLLNELQLIPLHSILSLPYAKGRHRFVRTTRRLKSLRRKPLGCVHGTRIRFLVYKPRLIILHSVLGLHSAKADEGSWGWGCNERDWIKVRTSVICSSVYTNSRIIPCFSSPLWRTEEGREVDALVVKTVASHTDTVLKREHLHCSRCSRFLTFSDRWRCPATSSGLLRRCQGFRRHLRRWTWGRS